MLGAAVILNNDSDREDPMAGNFPEYLTFDDVLMKPGASSVLPAEVSTATRLTKSLNLSIPIAAEIGRAHV